MKEMIELLKDDLRAENFSRTEMVVYGVLYPMLLTAVLFIVSALEFC